MTRWNLRSGLFVSITGLAAAMQPAHSAQPPDVVASDGSANTASGTRALTSLTAGSGNSAFGFAALSGNSTGSQNTAVGTSALSANGSGDQNSAFGVGTLTANTIGMHNVAIGTFALFSNTTASWNTASGDEALYSNTTGSNNTAFGYDALTSNTTGKGNEAQGVNALYSNTTGIRNLGIGSNASYGNTSGSYNIALGFNAGYNQTTGNDNIYIANPGVADESQTLRLGAQGTAGVQGSGILSAYVAGVATSQVTGSAVYVTPDGQLGVLASSERFKTDVETMGAASEKIAQLRPVTFKLKTDPRGTRQYGLIAEEVGKVYPELVIHGADGRIDGVRYEELAPMLLNVVQQQQAQLAAQAEVTRNLEAQVAQLNEFKQSMLAALREAQPKEQLAAR